MNINYSKEVFKIIRQNNSKYSIISFGHEEKCNRGLIKRAGTYGNGNYNFCTKLDELNIIIGNKKIVHLPPRYEIFFR